MSPAGTSAGGASGPRNGARRTNLTRSGGTWNGLLLEVRDRPRPGLCLRTADHRLLLTQGAAADPLLLASVDPNRQGVDFYRTGRYRPPVPPLRAQTAREYAGSAQRWAHRFATALTTSPDSPLHDGRWVLAPDPLLLLRPNHRGWPHGEYWRSLLVEGDPDGYIDWWIHNGSWEIFPLRAMPEAADPRVKAYRKQARDGTLPPVLLWWVSGLDSHVILDGHARLAAAIAESVEPAVLELRRVAPQDEVDTGTERAVRTYEAELARFTELRAAQGPHVPDGAEFAGPALARRLGQLRTARRPTWAWPLTGGTPEWRRIAREQVGDGGWEYA
ncbi:hypothetical protein GCM10010277_19950 [Streptomyces longisporoflavus]|uniref:hypothetical protein n=1 Tax=Streptomyces longisporoflavus TaxID=28044 RepID=UPI00167C6B4B|nr:hypothetical protein [Streptomyces longisporoflavus]GGV34589.1 hypothetical protein GCM10010277_19950 [Streptomyces longisporoflavus]